MSVANSGLLYGTMRAFCLASWPGQMFTCTTGLHISCKLKCQTGPAQALIQMAWHTVTASRSRSKISQHESTIHWYDCLRILLS